MMKVEHSGCHSLLGSLSEYLDGEAEAALCAEIEQHLDSCEKCQVVVDTLAKTITIYKASDRETLSGEAKKRIIASLNLEDQAG